MDQAVLAGVGNVYRAEVLFRHGVAPLTPGRALDRALWDDMWADLVTLMRDGVRVGRIDTVRPEHLPEAMGRAPRVDRHGGEVYVYRRAGEPCLVCGTPVANSELVGPQPLLVPHLPAGLKRSVSGKQGQNPVPAHEGSEVEAAAVEAPAVEAAAAPVTAARVTAAEVASAVATEVTRRHRPGHRTRVRPAGPRRSPIPRPTRRRCRSCRRTSR